MVAAHGKLHVYIFIVVSSFRLAMLQAAYNALPYALSPVLGNPLALAAVNVDRSASLPTQVCSHHALFFPNPLPAFID